MASSVLSSLRDLRVLVIHPQDSEGNALLQQLNRIGCQAEAVWPYPDVFPPTVDVVFLSVEQDRLESFRRLCDAEDRVLKPTLIAMVNYESPVVLQAVIDADPDAVMTRPIRSLGVMTNLVMARQIWIREEAYRQDLQKVRSKLRSMKKINQAKSILMDVHRLSEDEAYCVLRDKAMAKRVTIEEMASSIINANELLQPIRKSD